MNYLKTYINLCRTRSSNSKSQDVYRESHHVFPVSVFGKNEFLVNLTPREHYIAHWLLYRLCMKRYGKNHSNTYKMANAIMMMVNENGNVPRLLPSKFYDHARKIWRANWKNPTDDPKNRRYGKDNHMYQIGEKHHLFGVSMSQETKDKISKANKGKLLGDKNPSKREDVKRKISESWKDRKPLERDANKKSKLTSTQVMEIKEMWLKEKNHISGYRFCRNHNETYGVKPATIGNIIYSSDDE